jgi:hypothetical protein
MRSSRVHHSAAPETAGLLPDDPCEVQSDKSLFGLCAEMRECVCVHAYSLHTLYFNSVNMIKVSIYVK